MTHPTTLADLKNKIAAETAEKDAAAQAEIRTVLLGRLLYLQNLVNDELEAMKERKATLKSARTAITAVEGDAEVPNDTLTRVVSNLEIALGLVDPTDAFLIALGAKGSFACGGVVTRGAPGSVAFLG